MTPVNPYNAVQGVPRSKYVGWTGHWDDLLSPDYTVFKKLSQVAPSLAAHLLLFSDVNPNSICWPYLGVQMKEDVFLLFPGAVTWKMGRAGSA